MTTKKKVDVFEAYNRALTGPKVDKDEWDYEVIPENAKKMKEKYDIEFEEGEFIPTDEDLIDRLFQAGLEMLVETGAYCKETGRVIEYTEEEVLEAIKAAPKSVTLGEGKDAVELVSRTHKDTEPPIIQGGPTGAPVSEDLFVEMHEAFAQEPLVDTIVNGVFETINGNQPAPGSPWEIKASKSEGKLIRHACKRAGYPGTGL